MDELLELLQRQRIRYEDSMEIAKIPFDSINERITHNYPSPEGIIYNSKGLGEKLYFYRVDITDEIVFPKDQQYVVFQEGIEWIEAKTPYNKVVWKGKGFLWSYGVNFTYLNPYIIKEELCRTLMWRNITCLEKPISNEELLSIVEDILEKREKKVLKPIFSKKKRKVIFSYQCSLSPKEKLRIGGQEGNRGKSEESTKRIRETIDGWDFFQQGKITIKSLTKKTGMNKKTIEKYYPKFRAGIKELNQEFTKQLKKIKKGGR